MPHHITPAALQSSGQTYGLIIGLTVAIAVLVLRNSKPRLLRIDRLWIRSALFLVVIATTVIAAPPPLTPINLGILVLALVVGGALGWQRARFMRIAIDPDTQALTARASPVGMIFILALAAVRVGLRGALAGSTRIGPVSAVAAADALIVMAGAMMIVQGLEMWLRARRMLAQTPKPGAVVAPVVDRA